MLMGENGLSRFLGGNLIPVGYIRYVLESMICGLKGY